MKTVVVDDIQENCAYIGRILRNYDVKMFTDPAECLAYCRTNPADLLIADQKMPGMTGLEMIKALKKENPDFMAIIISAYSDSESLMDALNSNMIYKYVVKPFLPEQLLMTVNRAAEVLSMKRQNQRLNHLLRQENLRLQGCQPPAGFSGTGLDRLFGTSGYMNNLKALIRKYAALDLPVLILGETGTGKELAARALHENSARSRGPFITVNCSAIAEHLLESELFGYEKGAFSGAFQKKPGLVSQAQGGILFLDEIGDLSPGLQAKLLRVLQFKTFLPVGGVKEVQADFRVVCATNRHLERMVEAGTFRRDLLYRINTLPIELEPLRKHPEDIPLLVEELGRTHGLGLPPFEPDALELLKNYDFPGNVRELEGYLWKLHAHYPFHGPGTINAEFLRGILPELAGPVMKPGLPPPGLPARGDAEPFDRESPLDLNEVITDMEWKIIEQAYRSNDGNISRTARALSLSRQGLKNKLKRHDLIP